MDLTTLAATGLIALFLSALLAGDPVVMRSFSVPGPVEEVGYSEELVSTLLRERIRYIAHTADTARGETLSAYAAGQTALETLAQQFNLDKVVDAFQEFFELHRYSVSGYIVETPEGREFHLRADSAMDDRFTIKVSGRPDDNIETLINDMAEHFVARADPYVLALYYFRTEYKSRSFDKAIPMFEHCVKVLPVDLKKWPILVWGQALARRGDHEEAMLKYAEALDLDSTFGFALRSWGVSLWELERRDEALDKMQAAISVPTVFPDLYDVFGTTLEKAGDDVTARKVYVEGLHRFPNAPELQLALGHLYMRYGQYKPAVTLLEKALLADPENRDIQNDLNEALLSLAQAPYPARSSIQHPNQHN